MPRKEGSHLTYEERCHIQAHLKSEKSMREIAKSLGCSHTTVIREINRNGGYESYRQEKAQASANHRQAKSKYKNRKITDEIKLVITMLLEKEQWSPVQISGRLKKDSNISISHETIYKFVWEDKAYGGKLYKHLRHKAKPYNKRGSKSAGRGLIPGRRDIDERPLIVNEKSRFGDLELDTIIGANHKGAIVSIVDRASKFTRLILISQATAEQVSAAIERALSPLKDKKMIFTFTADNGKEFAYHAKITDALGGEFFFAKPYHSWQRGLNEHTNGLVRQYFPKGTDFTILTQEQVFEVEYKLNNRPRKCLNFSTPCEAFDILTSSPSSGIFQT